MMPVTSTEISHSPIRALAEELQRQLATKNDLIADTRRFSFAEPETGGGLLGVIDLEDGAQDYSVTHHAHRQISSSLDLQFKTYERLLDKHPDLLAHLANALFVREPDKHLIRTMDGGIRAFLSDKYRTRDNWDLLEALLPVFGEFDGIQFKECSLTETRMYVKTFLPGVEREVKVGDIVRLGAVISNSEVGSGSLYVYPFTDRLSCLNGMTHSTFGQRRIHVGSRIQDDGGEVAYEFFSDETRKLDDAAFFAKCADTLRGCLNESVFDAIVEQMRELADIRIDASPPDAVKSLTKTQRLTDTEGDSILTHLIEGGDLSAWGYVNGITAVAREHENADRRAELELLAGNLTANPDWVAALA
jgi:hypothetical protein